MRLICLLSLLVAAGCVSRVAENAPTPVASKFVSSPGATQEQVAEWSKGQTPEASLRALFHALYHGDREAAAGMTVSGSMQTIDKLSEGIGLTSLSSERLDFIIDAVSGSNDTASIYCHIGSHGGVSYDWAEVWGDRTSYRISALKLGGVWKIDAEALATFYPDRQPPPPEEPFPPQPDPEAETPDFRPPSELPPDTIPPSNE